MRTATFIRFLACALSCGLLSAAPKLRVDANAFNLQIAPGANATNQTIQAYNIGDGSLNLTVSISPAVGWMTASVGTPSACAIAPNNGLCTPLTIAFNTSSLARGTYAANVVVADPRAIDAPQSIPVTVQVGASPLASIDQYLAPGTVQNVVLGTGTCFTLFYGSCQSLNGTVMNDGDWLSVVTTHPTAPVNWVLAAQFAPVTGMAAGSYTGSLKVASPADSVSVPVTMHVTQQPIATPSTSEIDLRMAAGGPPMAYPFLPAISFSNSGMGTLAVSDVSASGAGVTATKYAGLALVTVDPGSLTAGAHTGTVTVQCNAANCPLTIPVNLQIDPPGAPVVNYQGVTDNATFSSFNAVAPGDVCVVKGQQLSSQAATAIATPPLPRQLGGASVFVNNVPAPLYYASAGQIAFQMPSSTTPGTALVQVVRDGQVSNTVSVSQVAAAAPALVVATDAAYSLRDASHPAHPGDWLILWAIGLGATNPAVDDGAAAPADPPAVAVSIPQVVFRANAAMERATPAFAGLSPGSAGLFQVNVMIPLDTPPGMVSIGLQSGILYSNFLQIAVQ